MSAYPWLLVTEKTSRSMQQDFAKYFISQKKNDIFCHFWNQELTPQPGIKWQNRQIGL